MRESLESLIQFAGWRVETFASAREFLGLLARRPVECACCLVLDVSLPDPGGLDVQQRVARERAGMPIIFITGHGDIPTTVRAIKAGALEFLTKPIGADVLLDAIRHAIDRSAAERQQRAETSTLRERYASLSRREREVLTRVVAGRLNNQVAADLGIRHGCDPLRRAARMRTGGVHHHCTMISALRR